MIRAFIIIPPNRDQRSATVYGNLHDMSIVPLTVILFALKTVPNLNRPKLDRKIRKHFLLLLIPQVYIRYRQKSSYENRKSVGEVFPNKIFSFGMIFAGGDLAQDLLLAAILAEIARFLPFWQLSLPT